MTAVYLGHYLFLAEGKAKFKANFIKFYGSAGGRLSLPASESAPELGKVHIWTKDKVSSDCEHADVPRHRDKGQRSPNTCLQGQSSRMLSLAAAFPARAE